MFTLIVAMFTTYAVVCLMGYEAGKDKAREEAEFDRHSDDALALVAEGCARLRHPSAR